jgi:hypothetical protein
MKHAIFIIVAAILAAAAVPARAGGTNGPVVKCHPKVCSNHAVPASTGKGNCKAHPASCR